MHLDPSAEEAARLIREFTEIFDNDRYQFSPRIRTRRKPGTCEEARSEAGPPVEAHPGAAPQAIKRRDEDEKTWPEIARCH